MTVEFVDVGDNLFHVAGKIIADVSEAYRLFLDDNNKVSQF
jgi:hypothetical protein